MKPFVITQEIEDKYRSIETEEQVIEINEKRNNRKLNEYEKEIARVIGDNFIGYRNPNNR